MSGRVRIKICGLTNAEDAALAVELGADALGFVLWTGSPRAMTAERVAAVRSSVTPLVTCVGVFVDARADHVRACVAQAGLDAVQLHGEIEPADEAMRRIGVLWSTALTTDVAVEEASDWPTDIMPIVDAHDPVRHGGTGRRADWERAARLSRVRPIVLAGGLTPENVGDAIRQVRPWAVDVSSGVERERGRKDPVKLRAFFAAVAASGGVAQ